MSGLTSVCRNGNKRQKRWLLLLRRVLILKKMEDSKKNTNKISVKKRWQFTNKNEKKKKKPLRKKWKANRNGSYDWQNSSSLLWERETNASVRRLPVSRQVQCRILLHLLFCCLPFDYFVFRTTLEDVRMLKWVKPDRVCLRHGFHPDLQWRTELILLYFTYFLFTNMQQRLGEKMHMHWFGDWT